MLRTSGCVLVLMLMAGPAMAGKHDALLRQAATEAWQCDSAIDTRSGEGVINLVVDFTFKMNGLDYNFTGTGWETIELGGGAYKANFVSDGYAFDNGSDGFGFFISSTHIVGYDPPLPDGVNWNDGRDIWLKFRPFNDAWGMEGYSDLSNGGRMTFTGCAPVH